MGPPLASKKRTVRIVLSTVRVSPNVRFVESPSILASVIVIVAAPTFIARLASRRTFGMRCGFDPFARVTLSVPCALTDAAPADGRACTSTSTRATDPSSAIFGNDPIRPSSSRL